MKWLFSQLEGPAGSLRMTRNMEGKQWKTLDLQIAVVKNVEILEGLRGRLGGS